MSHDHGQSKENKTIISFKNSFWLVIIIVFLFVAALNFIQSVEHDGGHGEAATEEHHGGGAAHHTEGTEHHATEPAHAEEPKPAEATAADSAAHAH